MKRMKSGELHERALQVFIFETQFREKGSHSGKESQILYFVSIVNIFLQAVFLMLKVINKNNFYQGELKLSIVLISKKICHSQCDSLELHVRFDQGDSLHFL